MKKYLYNGNWHSSLWELRGAMPNVVFPDDVSESLLENLGVELSDVADPDAGDDPQALSGSAESEIDAETSMKIAGGFDYEIKGELLHFSYDSFDQQNFADSANACMMLKSGMPGIPDKITWNAYKPDGELVRLDLGADDFLRLYVEGALAHKAACMEAGSLKKASLRSSG